MKYKGDENTREYILRLAVEAIERGGEAAVKAKEICRDADIAVTSLYHYFGSRDGLVIAAQAKRYTDSIQDVFAEWDRAVRNCKDRDDFIRIITVMLDRVMAPEREHGRLIRLNVLGSAYARPELRDAIVAQHEKMFAAQSETLEWAKAQGWVRKEMDPKALSAWHLGTLTGLTLLELGPTSVDKNEWKKIYLRALLGNVVAD